MRRARLASIVGCSYISDFMLVASKPAADNSRVQSSRIACTRGSAGPSALVGSPSSTRMAPLLRSTSHRETPSIDSTMFCTLTVHAVHPIPETFSEIAGSSFTRERRLCTHMCRSSGRNLPRGLNKDDFSKGEYYSDSCGTHVRVAVNNEMERVLIRRMGLRAARTLCHMNAWSERVNAIICGRIGPRRVLNPAQPMESVLRASCSKQQDEDNSPRADHHSSRRARCKRRCDNPFRRFTPTLLCGESQARAPHVARLTISFAPKPSSQIRFSTFSDLSAPTVQIAVERRAGRSESTLIIGFMCSRSSKSRQGQRRE